MIKKGSVSTRARLEEKGTGQVLHEEEKTETIDPGRPGGFVAVIKAGTFVRMSRNYQSLEVQVGIEFPVYVNPCDMSGLAEWFDKVDDMVNERVAEKIGDMEATLKEIAAKK